MKKEKTNGVKIEGQIWFGNLYKTEISKQSSQRTKVEKEFLNEIIEKTKNINIDNFGLFINKYIPIIKAEIVERNKRREWFSLEKESIGGESKSPFLKGLIQKSFDFKTYWNRIKQFVEEQKNSFENQKYKVIFSGSLKTQSRLIIGLGSSHVLETSITLHHIYGIPYIPASALKGVCRMVAFWKIAEKKGVLNDEKALNGLQNKFYGELSSEKDVLKYQLLFGAQNFKGLLLFLDAYPVIQDNQQIFDLDIMNVHYQSYYGDTTGRTPPGDWENPVPIVFLTLKEGIEFKFNILFDEYRTKGIQNLEEKEFEKLKIPKDIKKILSELNTEKLRGEIKELLESALKEFGVGAKTRLGYGIF